MTTQPRNVARVVRARDTSDGAGVRLRRSLGSQELPELDPFLLLDEFRSDDANDYLAGFPDHPHRGFETVTYMLAGHMEHRDHMGNRGDLAPGSVQWMTAGRGIIHSEMPRQEQGLMWGFQLWVNLPAKDKLCPPRYQDIAPEAVPELELEGGAGQVRVVAGSYAGTPGAVSGIATDPLYLDLRLAPNAELSVPVPLGHRALSYVYAGEATLGSASGTRVTAAQLAVLDDGDALSVRAGDEGARLLLIAGKPLDEPIVRHGPFVMNTREQIVQAVRDYQSGRLLG
ncbi:MAG TPA: pirin family protein [Polyangiales bacterium]|nr:pirin family protein [Polyangiales bacterium]